MMRDCPELTVVAIPVMFTDGDRFAEPGVRRCRCRACSVSPSLRRARGRRVIRAGARRRLSGYSLPVRQPCSRGWMVNRNRDVFVERMAPDAVLRARLDAVMDEGWEIFDRFDREVRRRNWHPFVA